MKKKIFFLLYVITVILLFCYDSFFQKYVETILNSKIGIWSAFFAFLLLLIGLIEIQYVEFKKLYSMVYYFCFNRYKGLWFAIKTECSLLFILHIFLFIFGKFLQVSLGLLLFFSFLVAFAIFSVVFFVAQRIVRFDNTLSFGKISFLNETKKLSRKSVFIREISEKIKIYDAMSVRILISVLFVSFNRIFESEKELLYFLIVCLLLISICGERYIKNTVKTMIYLFDTTKSEKRIVWKSLWIDCILNNSLLFIFVIFSSLGIKGAIFVILFGCSMTIYWDIFFMWIYKCRYSVGIVATLEFMALIILIIPIVNLFFCFLTYRKVFKKYEILA